MAKFDRYVIGQLLLLFGFFALVLVAVYWINHAIQLFDSLIADGHSATIFIEFTLLSLPKIIAMIVPMAGFVAAVYVTNRLSNDSELVVVQATGYSAWRVARPVLIFGVILTLIASVLAHLLVPTSAEHLKQREREISGSVSARLLREGVFLHPVDGVAFYIREITSQGELRDVFLSDLRDEKREITYTAQRAYLLRDAAGPRLVMLDGVAQTFDVETGNLSTTNYQELIRDVSALVQESSGSRRKISFVNSWDLLRDPDGVAVAANRDVSRVWRELHWRFSQSLLCLVAALIGQATLLAAGFSRFGVARQVVLAVFFLVVVKLLEGATSDVAELPGLWALNYFPAAAGLGIASLLYWRADHPHHRFWSRRQKPQKGAVS